MTLRVAMLAPISWRVPPRHYGPWEQFVSLLTEGSGARAASTSRLFATADSADVRAPRRHDRRPATPRTRTLDAKVWEALHIATVFERAAEFDLIHNNFDFLPLTYSGLVETPVVTTIHGFSSEQIVPGLRAVRRPRPLRRDQRRRPPSERSTTSPRSTTASTCAEFPLEDEAGRLPPVLRADPSGQGRRGGDRRRRARGPAARDRRASSRTGRTSSELVEPRHRRRARALRRPGRARASAARCWAARGALLHLDQLRRAVRVQRDRVDGVRHAGHRDATRLDARARPSRRERLPRRDAGRGRCRRRERRRRLDRAAVRASVERRFDVERMVDEYLEVYRRIVELHRARGSVSRPRLSPDRGGRVPARRQLLAGADRDGVVVALRSGGGRSRLRADRRRRSRLRAVLPALGGLPAGAGPGRRARCSNGWCRSPTSPPGSASTDAHAVHRPHERRELDPGLGAGRHRREILASGSSPAAGSSDEGSATGTADPAVWRRSGLAWHGEAAARARRARGAVGVGPRQRELQLRRPARPRSSAGAWLGAASARRSAVPTRRRASRSACTWRTWRRTVGLGRARPPTRATSSRCTATRSTRRWAHGPTDEHLLPFLARVTRWLGDGGDVLFSEFGLPTYRRGDPHDAAGRAPTPLVEEDVAAAYTAACTGRAASRRLSRCDALVLRRLRPGALGEPAARRGRPRAHRSDSGEPTARRNRRSRPSRRSPAPSGATARTRRTHGSTSTGTSSFSPRTYSCPASTAGIAGTREMSVLCPV